MSGFKSHLGPFLCCVKSAFLGLNFPISKVREVLVAQSCPSVVSNSATLWTVARQAPLFMEFSTQEYWSGLPFPFLGDLPDPGIETRSPALQANSLQTKLPGKA